jgi:drug/metabolite transporter (DMT)-like permease
VSLQAAGMLPLTTVAMVAFAANSLLCRATLQYTGTDAVAFTAVRLLAAAATLWLLVAHRKGSPLGGNWRSAMALFVYAAAFSYSYVQLPAGLGALLLFGAVQLTMIGWGIVRGERLRATQAAGLGVASLGLLLLLLPTQLSPVVPVTASALMLLAGFAWGVYSLQGRGASDPAGATRGNFFRCLAFLPLLPLLAPTAMALDGSGLLLGIASGAIASAGGYVIWYMVTRRLSATQAATVQLSVPVIAAGAGALLFGETLTALQLTAGLGILAGIWLSLWRVP